MVGVVMTFRHAIVARSTRARNVQFDTSPTFSPLMYGNEGGAFRLQTKLCRLIVARFLNVRGKSVCLPGWWENV